jgi:hypothetical protein
VATQIEEDAFKVLEVLASEGDHESEGGPLTARGAEIQSRTGLPPRRINDAVGLLKTNGYADGYDYLGTAPFDFGEVYITPLGRFEYQRLVAEAAAAPTDSPARGIDRLPVPIGSPFGFTDLDWEFVQTERLKTGELKVVLGYQFKSEFFDADALAENVQTDFNRGLTEFNARSGREKVELAFRPLRAGYGEHLFNEITRDIISADIAVFETSDLNPNVMIEMGVALTWGVRVLPITKVDRPKPPSDISGQTWAEYRENGTNFVDPDHEGKMIAMVERACRKKEAAAK